MTGAKPRDLLEQGVRGDDVKALQAALNGVMTDQVALKVDGKYGSKTRSRVRTYQERHRLFVDGRADRLTLVSLDLIAPTVMERQWLLDHRAQEALFIRVKGLDYLIGEGRKRLDKLSMTVAQRTVVGAVLLIVAMAGLSAVV